MTQKLLPARRVIELPPYVFSEIDKCRNAMLAKGRTLLDFGVGDPDLPAPDFIVKELAEAAALNKNQKYPSYDGSAEFKSAAADYMRERFGVVVNPSTQITSLIGSKEGLAHMSWAYLDPGDVALIPNPSFPVYANSARFSGAEVVYMPLLEENGFVPDVSKIGSEIAKRAKIMVLNYPNNPTGAVASKEALQKIVDWAAENEIIIVSDAAYAELVYSESDRLSLLSLRGADKIAVEFHSFSKTFNMTGFRLAFAVGNENLIGGLVKLKTNIDSGVFDAIQLAGVQGLKHLKECTGKLIEVYKTRLERMIKLIEQAGFSYIRPRGAFYLLVKCPSGKTSAQFTLELIEKCGVITTPGSGFGQYGEGYVRFALTKPLTTINRLEEALKNL